MSKIIGLFLFFSTVTQAGILWEDVFDDVVDSKCKSDISTQDVASFLTSCGQYREGFPLSEQNKDNMGKLLEKVNPDHLMDLVFAKEASDRYYQHEIPKRKEELDASMKNFKKGDLEGREMSVYALIGLEYQLMSLKDIHRHLLEHQKPKSNEDEKSEDKKSEDKKSEAEEFYDKNIKPLEDAKAYALITDKLLNADGIQEYIKGRAKKRYDNYTRQRVNKEIKINQKCGGTLNDQQRKSLRKCARVELGAKVELTQQDKDTCKIATSSKVQNKQVQRRFKECLDENKSNYSVVRLDNALNIPEDKFDNFLDTVPVTIEKDGSLLRKDQEATAIEINENQKKTGLSLMQMQLLDNDFSIPKTEDLKDLLIGAVNDSYTEIDKFDKKHRQQSAELEKFLSTMDSNGNGIIGKNAKGQDVRRSAKSYRDDLFKTKFNGDTIALLTDYKLGIDPKRMENDSLYKKFACRLNEQHSVNQSNAMKTSIGLALTSLVGGPLAGALTALRVGRSVKNIADLASRLEYARKLRTAQKFSALGATTIVEGAGIADFVNELDQCEQVRALNYINLSQIPEDQKALREKVKLEKDLLASCRELERNGAMLMALTAAGGTLGVAFSTTKANQIFNEVAQGVSREAGKLSRQGRVDSSVAARIINASEEAQKQQELTTKIKAVLQGFNESDVIKNIKDSRVLKLVQDNFTGNAKTMALKIVDLLKQKGLKGEDLFKTLREKLTACALPKPKK